MKEGFPPSSLNWGSWISDAHEKRGLSSVITQSKAENPPKMLKCEPSTWRYSSSEVSSERQGSFGYCNISLFSFLNSEVIFPFSFVKISEYTPRAAKNNQK